MPLPMFPKARGLTWEVHDSPNFSTRISKHVSGRNVRLELMSTPLYAFELVYEYLKFDQAAAGLQAVRALYLNCRGPARPFLFDKSIGTHNPVDSFATGQLLGTGNGTTASFAFTRTEGNWTEPVGQVDPNRVRVYLNGALQAPSGYQVSLPNTLIFGSAPGDGVAVTADYPFYYVCCFDEDSMDFEQFMYRLWKLQSCKFTTAKP